MSKWWLPVETGEGAPSAHGVPSTCTSQQKEPHPPLKPIDLLRNKCSQRSPSWPSSQGAQQHSGLDLKQIQMPQIHSQRCSLCSFLWPCMNSNSWGSMTAQAWHMAWQQQAGAAEPCPMLSPLFPFLLAQLGPGASWFPGNSWPLQKSWSKQRELCKSLGA